MRLQSAGVSHIKKIQNKTEKLFMYMKESRKSPTESSQWQKRKQIEPSKETSIEI